MTRSKVWARSALTNLGLFGLCSDMLGQSSALLGLCSDMLGLISDMLGLCSDINFGLARTCSDCALRFSPVGAQSSAWAMFRRFVHFRAISTTCCTCLHLFAIVRRFPLHGTWLRHCAPERLTCPSLCVFPLRRTSWRNACGTPRKGPRGPKMAVSGVRGSEVSARVASSHPLPSPGRALW